MRQTGRRGQAHGQVSPDRTLPKEEQRLLTLGLGFNRRTGILSSTSVLTGGGAARRAVGAAGEERSGGWRAAGVSRVRAPRPLPRTHTCSQACTRTRRAPKVSLQRTERAHSFPCGAWHRPWARPDREDTIERVVFTLGPPGVRGSFSQLLPRAGPRSGHRGCVGPGPCAQGAAELVPTDRKHEHSVWGKAVFLHTER